MKNWVSGSSTGNTLRMRLYSCGSTVTDRVEVGEMHRSGASAPSVSSSAKRNAMLKAIIAGTVVMLAFPIGAAKAQGEQKYKWEAGFQVTTIQFGVPQKSQSDLADGSVESLTFGDENSQGAEPYRDDNR